MSAFPTTAVVPLFTDSDGDIRVSGTRVLLDVIITAFHAGAAPEEIAQQFPSVPLADVYQVIAYYLNHTSEIDAYMAQRRAQGAVLQKEVQQRFNPNGVRARLLARKNSRPAGRQ